MHRSFSPANANVRSFDAGILPFRLVMPRGEAEFAEGRASAHYWARERHALDHEVRLIPPLGAFVPSSRRTRMTRRMRKRSVRR